MVNLWDVHLSDVEVILEPGGGGKIPFQPLVQGLRAVLSVAAIEKLARQGVALASTKAPVDITLTGVRIVGDAIEIATHAGKGFLGADLTARLGLSVLDGKEIRVALVGLDAPKFIPVAPMLNKALVKAAEVPGVRLDPDSDRAVLIDPAAILAQNGLPARLGPGVWSTAVQSDSVEVAFGES
ncbi:MAG: hypothetical protein ACJ789_15780 [Thermomicrobiales bacterium]